MRAWLLCAAILGAAVFAPCAAGQTEPPKRGVLIFDRSQLLTAAAMFEEGLQTQLAADGVELRIQREFLDKHLPDGPDFAASNEALAQATQSIRQRYAGQKIDVVVSFGRVPSNVLQGVPTVYVGQPPILGGGQAGARVPILSGDEFKRTVMAALALQPEVVNVVLLVGAGRFDRDLNAFAQAQLAPLRPRLRFIDWSGLTMEEMRHRLAQQSPDTVGLLLSVWEDGAGKQFSQQKAAELLTSRSAIPIYGFIKEYVERGVVGGYVIDFERLGAATHEAVKAILEGTDPRSISLPPGSGHVYQFSGEQMARFGLPEAKLPPGSQVLFRPEPFWRSHANWLLAFLGSLLLAAAVSFWALRRRAKAARMALEQQYELESLIAELCKTFINQPPDRVEFEINLSLTMIRQVLRLHEARLIEFSGEEGPSIEEEAKGRLLEREVVSCGEMGSRVLVPIETAGTVTAALELTRGPESKEWDAAYLDKLRTLGNVYAITLEYRRSNSEAEHLRGRLVNALEEERAAIARELHDDYSQRLAVVAMVTDQVRRTLDVSQGDERKRLDAVFDHAVKLSVDIRKLSHQMHSTSLDLLGLPAALQDLCDEIQNQHRIAIRLIGPESAPTLPRNASLCLFRVAQQALQNMVAHSGSKTGEVELTMAEGAIEISVRDFGQGFDATGPKKGLGLVSMRERVRLEGGEFLIRTRPGSGTEIKAIIPLNSSG